MNRKDNLVLTCPLFRGKEAFHVDSVVAYAVDASAIRTRGPACPRSGSARGARCDGRASAHYQCGVESV